MLKTVELSRSKKTKGCAVTYRAGNQNKFNTCPTSCALNGSGCGTNKIDPDYLNAVLDSKPKRGHAMTYTHFNPINWAAKLAPNKTTINYNILFTNLYFMQNRKNSRYYSDKRCNMDS